MSSTWAFDNRGGCYPHLSLRNSDVIQVKCTILPGYSTLTPLLTLKHTEHTVHFFYRMSQFIQQWLCDINPVVQNDFRHCLWAVICLDHCHYSSCCSVFSKTYQHSHAAYFSGATGYTCPTHVQISSEYVIIVRNMLRCWHDSAPSSRMVVSVVNSKRKPSLRWRFRGGMRVFSVCFLVSDAFSVNLITPLFL